mmetsp:Transcript_9041/g.27066  ORF Transcript_9041/g.27066 Transcript_9041/m.27066 type:complete len:207 (+) Transcript_9041:2233-2853(+)
MQAILANSLVACWPSSGVHSSKSYRTNVTTRLPSLSSSSIRSTRSGGNTGSSIVNPLSTHCAFMGQRWRYRRRSSLVSASTSSKKLASKTCNPRSLRRSDIWRVCNSSNVFSVRSSTGCWKNKCRASRTTRSRSSFRGGAFPRGAAEPSRRGAAAGAGGGTTPAGPSQGDKPGGANTGGAKLEPSGAKRCGPSAGGAWPKPGGAGP